MHSSLLTWCDSSLEESKIEVTMRKTEVLVKYKVACLKHIINIYDLIIFIFTQPLQTYLGQQCLTVHTNIMGYRTGNVCNVVVISAQISY